MACRGQRRHARSRTLGPVHLQTSGNPGRRGDGQWFRDRQVSIDTTHEGQIDKAAGLLRQLKDYNITGTAWVLKDANCVLQYQIDDEQIAVDGKVNKAHYAGTVMRR